MGSQRQQAGDYATQVQGQSVVINNHYTTTPEEIRAIANEVFENNYIELAKNAMDEANKNANEFLEKLLDKQEEVAPDQLRNYDSPRMLVAVYEAQKQYAETPDEALGDLLIDMLIERSSEEPRSFRDIVLRQSLQCAPLLSSPQIASLSALVILTQVTPKAPFELPQLIQWLDHNLRPFFGAVPKRQVEYAYMASCGVGTILMGQTPYELLIANYPAIFYRPFSRERVDRELPDIDEGATLETLTVENETQYRFTLEAIETNIIATGGITDYKNPNRIAMLHRKQRWTSDEVRDTISKWSPDLKEFFDLIEESNALHFHLSAIGTVIGAQAWNSISPHGGVSLDEFLQN